MIGTTVSHYKILEKLGGGGMGVVYRAEDLNLGRQVALKFLPEALAEDPEALARFQREARAASALNHPHICVIHELGEEEDRSFIVMELMEGKTLKYMVHGQPMSVDEIARIGVQVADALEAAHGERIIHRDIKPANLFVTAHGEAKVLDFGLAKITEDRARRESSQAGTEAETELAQEELTTPGTALGTVTYMSPEQVLGEELDERTDLFSLGVVLYEMATGRPPFSGNTSGAVFDQILHRAPTAPVRLNPELPDELEQILNKALEKDRELRYQSAQDLKADLKRLQRDTAAAEPSVTAEAVSPLIASSRRAFWAGLGAVALALAIVAGVWLATGADQPEGSSGRTVQKKSIAVLPLKNMSGDPANEYFSDGITEEIINQLAKIRSLKVISGTSTMQYKNTKKTLPEIRAELGVASILEGSVRRDSGRVRITARLVDASTDDPLWASTYDRELADIFAVQSDVALRIVRALEATVNPGEKKDIKQAPTRSTEAYDYFLRASTYARESYLEKDSRLAIQMYEKAVELDPEFALAYAGLSSEHSRFYWFSYDSSKSRVSRAKAAAERALQLQPQLPEAHWAMGVYHYRCLLEYERALEQFAIAVEGRPNSTAILEATAHVLRRQGKFEAALNSYGRVLELDPRSARSNVDIAETYDLMRRWKRAEEHYSRAISLKPDFDVAYAWLAMHYLRSEGDIEKARRLLTLADEMGRGDDSYLPYAWIQTELYEGVFQAAAHRLASVRWGVFDKQFFYFPQDLIEAQLRGLMDLSESEQASYEAARDVLEAKIQEAPEDDRLHSALGITYAGLGRKTDAIREGRTGIRLRSIEKDAYRGVFRLQDMARIYVMVGEIDSAIEQLDILLSTPSWITTHSLRLDPIWIPLHNQAKFKELVRSGR